MYKKAYILNFDTGGSFDSVKFHNELIKYNGIIGWWHYIESSYILIVENNVTATSLTDVVMNLIPNRVFIVNQLLIKDYNGWLPKEAWDWLDKNQIL
jgi:hypothetical protein